MHPAAGSPHVWTSPIPAPVDLLQTAHRHQRDEQVPATPLLFEAGLEPRGYPDSSDRPVPCHRTAQGDCCTANRTEASRSILVVAGLVLAIALVSLVTSVYRQAELDETDRLQSTALVLAKSYIMAVHTSSPVSPLVSGDLPDGLRLTILDTTGSAIADSHVTFTSLGCHYYDTALRRSTQWEKSIRYLDNVDQTPCGIAQSTLSLDIEVAFGQRREHGFVYLQDALVMAEEGDAP